MAGLQYRSLTWWCWLLAVCLLTAGLAGWTSGFLLAVGVAVFQLVYMLVRERSLRAFPVQVRLGFLLVVSLALPAPMQWLYWLPTLGTWALVLVGYCPMARLLSLMPWNRRQPFSFALLKQTILTPPVTGSFLQAASGLRAD